MTRVQTRVHDALVDWEARIDVLDVTVDTDPETRDRLDIKVEYRVRATNALHNLVYPFYLDGVALDPTLNQADMIHPNAAGVAVIVKNMLPALTAWLGKLA